MPFGVGDTGRHHAYSRDSLPGSFEPVIFRGSPRTFSFNFGGCGMSSSSRWAAWGMHRLNNIFTLTTGLLLDRLFGGGGYDSGWGYGGDTSTRSSWRDRGLSSYPGMNTSALSSCKSGYYTHEAAPKGSSGSSAGSSSAGSSSSSGSASSESPAAAQNDKQKAGSALKTAFGKKKGYMSGQQSDVGSESELCKVETLYPRGWQANVGKDPGDYGVPKAFYIESSDGNHYVFGFERYEDEKFIYKFDRMLDADGKGTGYDQDPNAPGTEVEVTVDEKGNVHIINNSSQRLHFKVRSA